jgi:hypothetical protein
MKEKGIIISTIIFLVMASFVSYFSLNYQNNFTGKVTQESIGNNELVLDIKFDEGSGSIAYDSSGKGNNGIISGATWLDESECISGKCLSFDGIEDWVIIPNNHYLNGTFTIEVWAKPVDGGRNTIIGTLGTKYPYSHFGFSLHFRGKDYWSMISGGIANSTSGIVNDAGFLHNYPLNEWYHIVYIVTPTGWKMYLNGENVASDSYPENTPILVDNKRNITIGALTTYSSSTYRGRDFNGTIDEVKVYNYEISAETVKNNYLENSCGNLICDKEENYLTCSKDCQVPVCGDFVCEQTETPQTCPGECFISCNSNSDCDDGYAITEDTCFNPGTIYARCEHIPTRPIAECYKLDFVDLNKWKDSGIFDACDIVELNSEINEKSPEQVKFLIDSKNSGKIIAKSSGWYPAGFDRTGLDLEKNKTLYIQKIFEHINTTLNKKINNTEEYAGIIINEVSSGASDEFTYVISRAIELAKKKNPDKLILVWGGGMGSYPRDTRKRLIEHMDFWIPEVYLWGSRGGADGNGNPISSELVRSQMYPGRSFENFYSGSGKKVLNGIEVTSLDADIAGGDSGSNFYDTLLNVDAQKLWDTKMYYIKEASNQGLSAGVGVYTVDFLDAKARTWMAKLIEHYFIKDCDNMFSDGKFNLTYVKDSGFENKNHPDWTFIPGEGGLIKIANFSNATEMNPAPAMTVSGKTSSGTKFNMMPNKEHLLYMKRGSSFNEVNQTITLEVGKNYSLEVYSKKQSRDYGESGITTKIIDVTMKNEITYKNYTITTFCLIKTSPTAKAGYWKLGVSPEICLSKTEANRCYTLKEERVVTRETIIFTATSNKLNIVIDDYNAEKDEINVVDFVRLKEYPFSFEVKLTCTKDSNCYNISLRPFCIGEEIHNQTINFTCLEQTCSRDFSYVFLEKCENGCMEGKCCIPESNELFCLRYNIGYDNFTSLDNCGKSRTVDCGKLGISLVYTPSNTNPDSPSGSPGGSPPPSGGSTYNYNNDGGDSCTTNYTCSEWGECIEGMKTRTCINNNPACSGEAPSESEICEEFENEEYLSLPQNITVYCGNESTINAELSFTNIGQDTIEFDVNSDFLADEEYGMIEVNEEKLIGFQIDCSLNKNEQKFITITDKNNLKEYFIPVIIEKEREYNIKIIVYIILAAIVLLAVIFLVTKKIHKSPDKKKILSKWVEEQRKAGHDDNEIKNALSNAGFSEDILDKIKH